VPYNKKQKNTKYQYWRANFFYIINDDKREVVSMKKQTACWKSWCRPCVHSRNMFSTAKLSLKQFSRSVKSSSTSARGSTPKGCSSVNRPVYVLS